MQFSPRKILLVAVLVVAMLLELSWVFWPRLNLLADPYRFNERQRAMGEWAQQRTPESRAAWDHERKLLHEHLQRTAFLMIAAAVIEGGVVIVIVRRAILSRSHEHAAKHVP